MAEKFLSKISRNLYTIPGGYYLVLVLIKLFNTKNQSGWKIYKFKDITFKVDTNTYLGRLLYWRGAHEWAPIFTLKKIIKHGYVCIDVGANQGEYTLWLAKLTGEKGKVISFEPLSKMFQQLNDNILLNKELATRIIPLKKGLSDTISKIPIYAVNSNDKFSDNEGMPSIFPTNNRNAFIENIDISTLDEELKMLNISKVDFIKIDVEGAELNVLKGALNTIKFNRPKLLIEFNEPMFNAAGYSSVDITDFLKPFGYKFYLVGNRGYLKKINPKNIPEYCNIIAQV